MENQAENGKLGERLCVSSGFHLFKKTLNRPLSYWSDSTRDIALSHWSDWSHWSHWSDSTRDIINKDVLFINMAISDSVSLNVNF